VHITSVCFLAGGPCVYSVLEKRVTGTVLCACEQPAVPHAYYRKTCKALSIDYTAWSCAASWRTISSRFFAPGLHLRLAWVRWPKPAITSDIPFVAAYCPASRLRTKCLSGLHSWSPSADACTQHQPRTAPMTFRGVGCQHQRREKPYAVKCCATAPEVYRQTVAALLSSGWRVHCRRRPL
jgi:hypothetical protein